VTAPDLEQKHREGVLRAVRACLIHNTLLHAPTIETDVVSPTSGPPSS
jgi:hypothetical protein